MALSSTPEISKTFTYLVEVETVAQEICTLKEEKLELANLINKLRESLRALQVTEDKRSYLKVGTLFVEHTTEECRKIVEEDLEKTKEHYNSTCAELQEKVFKLRDLEHQPKIKGIGLSPLSYAEAKGLMKGFGVE